MIRIRLNHAKKKKEQKKNKKKENKKRTKKYKKKTEQKKEKKKASNCYTKTVHIKIERTRFPNIEALNNPK